VSCCQSSRCGAREFKWQTAWVDGQPGPSGEVRCECAGCARWAAFVRGRLPEGPAWPQYEVFTREFVAGLAAYLGCAGALLSFFLILPRTRAVFACCPLRSAQACLPAGRCAAGGRRMPGLGQARVLLRLGLLAAW